MIKFYRFSLVSSLSALWLVFAFWSFPGSNHTAFFLDSAGVSVHACLDILLAADLAYVGIVSWLNYRLKIDEAHTTTIRSR